LAVKLVRSWSLFLAGGQSNDRTQDGVEVVPSAGVTRGGSPILQVADAVLHADPLRRVSPAFGLVRCARAGMTGSWFFRWAGRGVTTAPAV